MDLFNKTFFRFAFSFIVVLIVAVSVIIIIGSLGSSNSETVCLTDCNK